MSSGLKMPNFENSVEIFRRKPDKQACSSEAGSGLETEIWGHQEVAMKVEELTQNFMDKARDIDDVLPSFLPEAYRSD